MLAAGCGSDIGPTGSRKRVAHEHTVGECAVEEHRVAQRQRLRLACRCLLLGLQDLVSVPWIRVHFFKQRIPVVDVYLIHIESAVVLQPSLNSSHLHWPAFISKALQSVAMHV